MSSNTAKVGYLLKDRVSDTRELIEAVRRPHRHSDAHLIGDLLEAMESAALRD